MRTKIIIGLGVIVLLGVFAFGIGKYYKNNTQEKVEEIKTEEKKKNDQQENSLLEEVKKPSNDEKVVPEEDKKLDIKKEEETGPTLDKFLLSIYNPPYAWRRGPYRDKNFDDYQEAGFDTVLWARDDANLMEKIHNHHLKYFLNIRAVFPEEGPGNIDYLRGVKNPDEDNEIYNVKPAPLPESLLKKVDILVEKYKDGPDLIGYWIADEPAPLAYGNIAKLVERIRTKDSQHYNLVNIGDNEYTTPKNIDKFLETTKVKVLCFDRYNFFNGFDRNKQFLQRLGLVRQKALEHGVIFYGIVQAVGTNGTSAGELDWRTPSLNEMRWLAYSMLTYGAHGLIWFHWDAEDWGVIQNPARGRIQDNLQKVNKEIKLLGEEMVKLQTTDVYRTWGMDRAKKIEELKLIYPTDKKTNLLVGIFQDNRNQNYFMLTNMSYRASLETEIEITKNFQNLEVFNPELKVWEKVETQNNSSENIHTLNIELGPSEGKLFRME